MLQYYRIDVSERIDINKTIELKEYMLCHYWYFKDVSFKFQPYVCNGCHTVLKVAYELKNIAISNAKGVDYRCILCGINKNDAVYRLDNYVFEDKGLMMVVNSSRFYHVGVMN